MPIEISELQSEVTALEEAPVLSEAQQEAIARRLLALGGSSRQGADPLAALSAVPVKVRPDMRFRR